MFIDLYGEGDEYLGQDKVDKFYEEYITFNEFIEVRVIDYEQEYKGRPLMHSRYASDLKSLKFIFNQFSSSRFNVYIGSNTREVTGRLDADIKFRRTFYFDLEAIGKKPPIHDKEYYRKLIETVIFIRNKLTEVGIRINVLKISGRGLHVGVKMKPILDSEYRAKFIKWYKDFKKKYNNSEIKDDATPEELANRPPHKDIKFMDSVYNISRIESAPGTIHTKYEEKPLRQILFLSKYENDMEEILKNIVVPPREIKEDKSEFRKKYTKDSIFLSPEFQLLINNDDLPEGDLHSKIILMIKILVRDSGIKIEPIAEKFQELGYDEVMDLPPPDYSYNPMIYNWWCIDNFEYCEDNKIKMNLECYRHMTDKLFKCSTIEGKPSVYFAPEDLATYREVLDFIRRFNTKSRSSSGTGFELIYKDFLKEYLIKNIKNKKLSDYVFITNEMFFEYIYHRSYPR